MYRSVKVVNGPGRSVTTSGLTVKDPPDVDCGPRLTRPVCGGKNLRRPCFLSQRTIPQGPLGLLSRRPDHVPLRDLVPTISLVYSPETLPLSQRVTGLVLPFLLFLRRFAQESPVYLYSLFRCRQQDGPVHLSYLHVVRSAYPLPHPPSSPSSHSWSFPLRLPPVVHESLCLCSRHPSLYYSHRYSRHTHGRQTPLFSIKSLSLIVLPVMEWGP